MIRHSRFFGTTPRSGPLLRKEAAMRQSFPRLVLFLLPIVALAGLTLGDESPGERSQRTPGTSPPVNPLPAAAPKIPPSCPNDPARNVPGVMCEDFDTDRNGVPGFQWSRLPVAADPIDFLLAYGDADDDVLGYTIDGGPSPLGTAAVTCPDDVTYPACQAPVAEENDWHLHSSHEGPGEGYDPPMRPGIGAPDGGRAHGGLRSMHWGRHTDPSSTLADALRFRQVAAFVLDSQGDPGIGGIVPGPASTLEFWHMISVFDDEDFGAGFIPPGASFGGGQVQISLLESTGFFSRWKRLTPTFNGYDSLDQGVVSVCAFDPGDDENPPADETFCDSSDSPMWADIGDTLGADPACVTDTNGDDPLHKDCGDIQSCAGGPGCAETGSVGPGVWARSSFDLSPFAGRVARLRWIAMNEGGWSFGTSRSEAEPNGGLGNMYLGPDDGWYIDDIVLTDLRTAPGGCVAPGEAQDLSVSGSMLATLAWDAPGGGADGYDVLRAEAAPDFMGATASCIATDEPATTALDGEAPSSVFYYLVRATSACAAQGHAGTDSSGAPRQTISCQ